MVSCLVCKQELIKYSNIPDLTNPAKQAHEKPFKPLFTKGCGANRMVLFVGTGIKPVNSSADRSRFCDSFFFNKIFIGSLYIKPKQAGSMDGCAKTYRPPVRSFAKHHPLKNNILN